MGVSGDNSTVTSLNPIFKEVFCGKQKKHWLELQFVDENNNAVSGLNVQLEYHPLATEKEMAMFQWGGHSFNATPPPHPPAGITDSEGLVRFDDLYWIHVNVTTDGQQLADEMEQRPLGIRRNPNSQPVSGNVFKRETRDMSWRSDVQEKAESAGYQHHYVTIGELCNRLPDMPGWDATEPPVFHFPPGRSLKGTVIERETLDKRHVIEICPFRAWVLALHDRKDYDLANGLNLGIMADLAYAKEFDKDKDAHLISHFFEQKCRDLSCIPQFAEYPNYFHTLAVDVPFRGRYLTPLYLNTSQVPEEHSPEGDSRLFAVECASHVLVAWCGTASGLNVVTDASFAPKRCPGTLGGSGNVHGGFLEAYQLMSRKFEDKLDAINRALKKKKKLFICGHSLGGSLALLYAAEMKDFNPVLYTYGMPRTFTRSAMASLTSITHYRHVNDNDIVPQVPPDMDMDSLFYQTLGPLGDKLGFDWLVTSIDGLYPLLWQRSMEAEMGVKLKRDPYWHHGNAVAFLRAVQSYIRRRQSQKPGEPFPVTISSVERAAVKLFVVPSLNDDCLKASGEHQAAFTQCLAPGELEKRFPRGENLVSAGSTSKPLNHFMASKYLPYIHNQVLELANPALPMERKSMRNQFREAVEESAAEYRQPDEVARNRIFLSLQDKLPLTLQRMRENEEGLNALSRFVAVTEEEVELSN